MKELTTEEKAKRYDEILVKLQEAKVDNNVCDDRYCCVIDDIVPELTDIEDERMIQYFKDLAPFDKADVLYSKYGFSHKDAIEWLASKSGHTDITDKLKEEYQKGWDAAMLQLPKKVDSQIWQIANNSAKTWEESFAILCASQKAYEKGKKDALKDQKSAEWSEEDKYKIDTLLKLCVGRQVLCSPTVPEYKEMEDLKDWLCGLRNLSLRKPNGEHYELEEFAKIVRGNLTGISKAVQKLFGAKYLQLTGNKMFGGFKD